jgi:glutathione S-transferase
MVKAILTISSKNYGAWALRGWLMTRLSGIAFEEKIIAPDDPSVRADLLLLSSSIRVPALEHKGNHVWDTLAIGEYLNETFPKARLLPSGAAARAHCRSICGEMHSGFSALRSALPMNIKGDFPNFKVWSRAQADIDRIIEIWTDCLKAYGGPFLFGAHPCNADAMFAPVVTRFRTYHVELPVHCKTYAETVWQMPEMQEWVSAALAEPDEIDELDAEF